MARHLIEGEVLAVAVDGAPVGIRRRLNLAAGAGVTLAGSDNPGEGRIDVTVSAAGGGAGVASFNGRDGAVTLQAADVEGALDGVGFGASEVRVGGTRVLGPRQPDIPDATGADAVTRFNALLAALRAHGLIG